MVGEPRNLAIFGCYRTESWKWVEGALHVGVFAMYFRQRSRRRKSGMKTNKSGDRKIRVHGIRFALSVRRNGRPPLFSIEASHSPRTTLFPHSHNNQRRWPNTLCLQKGTTGLFPQRSHQSSEPRQGDLECHTGKGCFWIHQRPSGND